MQRQCCSTLGQTDGHLLEETLQVEEGHQKKTQKRGHQKKTKRKTQKRKRSVVPVVLGSYLRPNSLLLDPFNFPSILVVLGSYLGSTLFYWVALTFLPILVVLGSYLGSHLGNWLNFQCGIFVGR